MHELKARAISLASRLRMQAGLMAAERAVSQAGVGMAQRSAGSYFAVGRAVERRAVTAPSVEVAERAPGTAATRLLEGSGGPLPVPQRLVAGLGPVPVTRPQAEGAQPPKIGPTPKLRLRLMEPTARPAAEIGAHGGANDAQSALRVAFGPVGTDMRDATPPRHSAPARAAAWRQNGRGLAEAEAAISPLRAAGGPDAARAGAADGAGSMTMPLVVTRATNADAFAAGRSSAPRTLPPSGRDGSTAPIETGAAATSPVWGGGQDGRTSAPMQAASADGPAGGEPGGGDVYLDGALMGRWVARNLAHQAAMPASGGAGFDPRRGVFPTGAMIGG